MIASFKPQQPHRAHTLVGVGAAFVGVALGFVVVSLGERGTDMTVAQTLAQRCQTNSRAGQVNAPMVTDQNCMIQCQGGPTGKGPKGKANPACICGQELGKADAGVTNCHNPGDCNPPAGLPACGSVEKPKLPGEEKMPPKGEEKGGMPPMLPMLPMPMPKMPMPMMPPTSEECKQEPKPANCEGGVSNSLFDNFKNLFTGDTSGSKSAEAAPSVVDRLKSFIGMGANDSSAASAVNNPTEATVTPVPSGSNSGQLTPSGGTQNNGSQSGSSQAPTSEVTGFGLQSSGETTSQGLTARIGQTLSAIGFTLRNMLSSLRVF